MTDEMRKRALALFKPPFEFVHGYILDRAKNTLADNTDCIDDKALRLRGWGRIGYMPDAANLHDAVGELIAEALTKYWGTP